MKSIKRIALILLALSMTISVLAACTTDEPGTPSTPASTGDSTTTTNSAATDTTTDAPPPERIRLTFAVTTEKGGAQGMETQTYQEMEELLGVDLILQAITQEQENLMLAARDLPDMLNATDLNFPALIEGGLIIPLDDLLEEFGPDILATDVGRLDFLRRFSSNGTGQLWGLTSFTGLEAPGHYPSVGSFFLRWDLLTELGRPELLNTDDVLDVLYQMVQMEPQTPDGLPVFGLGLFDGWGMWPYTVHTTQSADFNLTYQSNSFIVTNSGRETSLFTDLEGSNWSGIKFFNKAHQMGIFDVDSIVQPDSEYANKCDNGQYMAINAPWWMFNFNQAMRDIHGVDTLIGYQCIPMDGAVMWARNNNEAGTVSYFNVISASCQNPGAAMSVLNYLNSFDGIRHLMNGTLGDTIEEVDGKLEMMQDIIERRNAGDPALENRFFTNQNLFGWAVAHPHTDGQPINLLMTPRAFSLQNTALDIDFSSHFGALYPNGVIDLMIDKGRMFDMRDFDWRIWGAMETPPDNIQRIHNLLNEILLRAAAQAVLAPNDAAFMAIYDAAVAEMESSGLAEAMAWDKQNLEQAIAQFR